MCAFEMKSTSESLNLTTLIFTVIYRKVLRNSHQLTRIVEDLVDNLTRKLAPKIAGRKRLFRYSWSFVQTKGTHNSYVPCSRRPIHSYKFSMSGFISFVSWKVCQLLICFIVSGLWKHHPNLRMLRSFYEC